MRTHGQTDMARLTQLLILIKNIYILYGRKRSACYVLFNVSGIPYYCDLHELIYDGRVFRYARVQTATFFLLGGSDVRRPEHTWEAEC